MGQDMPQTDGDKDQRPIFRYEISHIDFIQTPQQEYDPDHDNKNPSKDPALVISTHLLPP
jgi:hypothetical protein